MREQTNQTLDMSAQFNYQKKLQLLGMAQKSGNLISGTDLVLRAIEKQQAKLVIIAEDISESSRKKLINKCVYYKIDYTTFGTNDQLSQALGKKRSVVALMNQGFKKSFLKTKGNTHMK